MPHRCVKCGAIFGSAAKQLLNGCDKCGGRFFYYIREEKLKKVKVPKLSSEEIKKVEKDIRELTGVTDESLPVILDIETVRITEPGKYEIDLVKLFSNKELIVYRIQDGKYLIDFSNLNYYNNA